MNILYISGMAHKHASFEIILLKELHRKLCKVSNGFHKFRMIAFDDENILQLRLKTNGIIVMPQTDYWPIP